LIVSLPPRAAQRQGGRGDRQKMVAAARKTSGMDGLEPD
jgi:hypothetical protein